jgi:cytochrome c oxidase cbb3-type subunit 2
MPAYRWLARREAKLDDLPERLATLRRVGVPYTDDQIENAAQDARGQVSPDSERAAGLIKRYGEATNIRNFDGQSGGATEMDAMIAYLQVLGQLIDPETIAAAQAQVEEED